jgi:hypothetical protein
MVKLNKYKKAIQQSNDIIEKIEQIDNDILETKKDISELDDDIQIKVKRKEIEQLDTG